MKLIGKIVITGEIHAETGLHIGGSKAALNIGGIDKNNVIKTAKGIPYIPGSSLKGKLRSLLAKKEGSEFFSKDDRDFHRRLRDGKLNGAIADDSNGCYIADLFGHSADSKSTKVGYSRIFVRDCFLKNAKKIRELKEEHPYEMEFDYTDIKTENVIDRRTGAAKGGGLRQVERVPSGAIFNLDIVFNVFQQDIDNNKFSNYLNAIKVALNLLEDDYLGGQGSRGYGKVRIENLLINVKQIKGNTYPHLTVIDSYNTEKIVALFDTKNENNS